MMTPYQKNKEERKEGEEDVKLKSKRERRPHCCCLRKEERLKPS